MKKKTKIIIAVSVLLVILIVAGIFIGKKLTAKPDPLIGKYKVVSVLFDEGIQTYKEDQIIEFKNNGYFEMNVKGLGHYVGSYEKDTEAEEQEGIAASYKGAFLHDSVSNLEVSIALDEDENQVYLYITGDQVITIVAERTV